MLSLITSKDSSNRGVNAQPQHI